MKTKTISILGSTGSIGRQTLDVVDGLGIQVAALAAQSGPSWPFSPMKRPPQI